MKKRSIILASVAVIAVCLSLIVGTTFALFTSESRVDISVSSGKVDVSATVENVYHKSLDTEYVKGVGDKVAIGENDNSISFDNVIPGDGVKFDIVLNNNSTVDVKYRTVIKAVADDGLFGALAINMGDMVYDGSTVYSKWDTMSAKQVKITVTIELPSTDNDNAYMEKSCKLVYNVEAVQGNANPTDGVAHIVRDGQRVDYLTLQAAFDSIDKDEAVTVDLDEDITLVHKVGVPVNSTVTLNGNNHTITFNAPTEQGICFGGSKTNSRPAINVVATVNDLNVAGVTRTAIWMGYKMNALNNVNVSGQFYESAVNFYGNCGGTLTDCVIENTYPTANGQYCLSPIDGHSTGLFANRDSNNQVVLNNSSVDVLFINSSKSGYAEKAVVNAGSVVGAFVIDPGEKDRNSIITVNDGATVNLYAEYIGDDAYTGGLFYLLNADMSKTNTVIVSASNGLKTLANLVNGGTSFKGYTVELICNIDMNNAVWTTGIGSKNNAFQGMFDGKGYAISNLTINSVNDYVGLFGNVGEAPYGTTGVKDLALDNVNVTGGANVAVVTGYLNVYATVSNVTVTNSSATGCRYVGGIVGYTYGTIQDCTVINCVLKGIPNSVGDNTYDNGDKIGGIVGYNQYCRLYNNTVSDTTVMGYRDFGGYAGCVGTSDGHVVNPEITGSVQNITLVYVDMPTGGVMTDNATHVNAGAAIGRVLATITDENIDIEDLGGHVLP